MSRPRLPLPWRRRATDAQWWRGITATAGTTPEPEPNDFDRLKSQMSEALPQLLTLPAEQLAMAKRQAEALEDIAESLGLLVEISDAFSGGMFLDVAGEAP